MLIGIFYRVGFWISHIDDTDISEESEQIEQQHLLRALQKISTAKGATEFIRELAAEAMRRSGDQAHWLGQEETLLEDVNQAARMMRLQATEEDYRSFGKSVMFAATSVARAFREEPETKDEEGGAMSRLLEKASSLVGAVTDREAYQDMSISPAEDTALHELSVALTVR